MKTLFFLLFISFGIVLHAQHDHHQHHPADTTKTKAPRKTKNAPKVKPAHDHHQHDSISSPMSHAYSLNLPMTRNGSGTAWLPDSTPVYAYSAMTKRWMFMVHGNLFLRYNHQDVFRQGSRGGSKADAPNMFMFMGQTTVGSRGLFHFSTMLSLDPITVGGEGYPLLFQSGETFEGRPLVDRQHPHDLLSELSIGYTHAFSKNADLTGYLALPGEPALGPVAFMHRVSAMNNPDAPLSHHWQDATHITVGVATIGLRIHQVKAEASVFSGREPDENRYDIDEPRFDSYALRLLYNPNAFFSFQVSQAFIKSPEQLRPEEDVARTTASIINHYPLARKDHFIASSVVWGYNSGHAHEHSVLGESNLQMNRAAVYSRYEWVQKSEHELSITSNEHDRLFNVQALTVGGNYIVLRKLHTNLAAGAQFTIYHAPQLASYYGNNPVAAEIYVRFYPEQMRM